MDTVWDRLISQPFSTRGSKVFEKMNANTLQKCDITGQQEDTTGLTINMEYFQATHLLTNNLEN